MPRCETWAAVGWRATPASACRSASTTTVSGTSTTSARRARRQHSRRPRTRSTRSVRWPRPWPGSCWRAPSSKAGRSLDDEATNYLAEPYPEPRQRRRERSAGAPRQHDVAARWTTFLTSRRCARCPASRSRPRACGCWRTTRSEEFLRQLHRVMPRRAPGIDPAQSNVASMLLGVALREDLWRAVRDHPRARDRKASAHGQRHAADDQTTGAGLYEAKRGTAGILGADGLPSGSLRYSTDDLLRYAAWQTGGTRRVGQARASAHLADADKRQAWRCYWIISETSRGRRLQLFGRAPYGFASMCELYPGGEGGGGAAVNKAADGAQESLRALSANIVGAR